MWNADKKRLGLKIIFSHKLHSSFWESWAQGSCPHHLALACHGSLKLSLMRGLKILLLQILPSVTQHRKTSHS